MTTFQNFRGDIHGHATGQNHHASSKHQREAHGEASHVVSVSEANSNARDAPPGAIWIEDSLL
jgi:hypothetical protein